MRLPEILTLLVVFVAVPLNWWVTILLWRLSHSSPDLGLLRERAVVATAVALIVTVFGAIFVNNGMASPIFGSEQTQIITRGALLALSTIPALYWLRRYRRG